MKKRKVKVPAKNKPTPKAPPKGVFSQLQLAADFDLDRRTVKKLLKGVEPAYRAPKFIGYRLTQKNKEGKTVKWLLEHHEDDDPKLTEARTRKTLTEAERLELKLARERGELMSRDEVKRAAYDLVSAMHKRLTRYPREAKRRMKLTPEDVRTMETDLGLIFQELKQDYPAIL